MRACVYVGESIRSDSSVAHASAHSCAFAENESIRNIKLTPDGQWVTYLRGPNVVRLVHRGAFWRCLTRQAALAGVSSAQQQGRRRRRRARVPTTKDDDDRRFAVTRASSASSALHIARRVRPLSLCADHYFISDETMILVTSQGRAAAHLCRRFTPSAVRGQASSCTNLRWPNPSRSS